MLEVVFEFVKRHILIVFVKMLRNYLIGGVARKVGRKLKEFVFGEEEDFLCSECDSTFTYSFLYDEYYFANNKCPSCFALNSIKRANSCPQDKVRVYHLSEDLVYV